MEVEILPYRPENVGRIREYLQMREEIFNRQKGWELYSYRGLEFDQYDRFSQTVYFLISVDGEIKAGARVLPTWTTFPERESGDLAYSYMIRDACLGLLPGMPEALCDELPDLDSSGWECSRIFSTGNSLMGVRLFQEVLLYLQRVGADRCYWIGPPAFGWIAERKLKLDAVRMGPVFNRHGGDFLAMHCRVAGA